MNYKVFGVEEISAVKRIYADENWLAYLGDDEKLINAFENSIYILGAFEGDKLIGFIRCVGDGQHVLLIQDLIIDKEHQRKGIGSELLDRIMEKYKQVRMITLITEANDERDNMFYQAKGMRKLISKNLVAYMR